MSSPKRILILGTGGNSVEIFDTINEINSIGDSPQYECLGFLDDDQSSWGKLVCGVRVLGPLTAAKDYPDVWFVNGIGTHTNFWKKDAIIAKTAVPNDRFQRLVHPSASVSRMSEIGHGTVVLQNATVTSNTKIGSHVVILPNSIISHDTSIGDYSCVAGGASISGGATVGVSCYLGANSAIRERVKIGDCSLIGIGAVVLQDVPENSVMVGNPAKFLRYTRPEHHT
jgi:sugar O-acyltransferase (sialic acid O-acetyltransferase NeuD family)